MTKHSRVKEQLGQRVYGLAEGSVGYSHSGTQADRGCISRCAPAVTKMMGGGGWVAGVWGRGRENVEQELTLKASAPK